MTPPQAPRGAQAFLFSSGGSPPLQTWLFVSGGPGRSRWGISLGSIGPSPGRGLAPQVGREQALLRNWRRGLQE